MWKAACRGGERSMELADHRDGLPEPPLVPGPGGAQLRDREYPGP